MKLKYLGTAAAEGIPAVFCNCPLCKKARLLGGRELRSRAQTLINDDLLLDFGPDTYWHVCRYGLDLSKIRSLLITHSHEDHYTPSELSYREHGFAYLSGDRESDDADFPPLDIYMSAGSYAYECVRPLEETDLAKRPEFVFHTVKAFEPFAAGRYTVTPLAANHAPGFEALIYLISDGSKTLLYAHDTGIFPEETWGFLSTLKLHIDFASLDCTGMASGHNTGGGRHMNLERNKVVRARLTELGLADDATLWCCNHFSHNGKSTHAELTEIMAKEGFLVSYDGMEVEI